MIEQKLPPYDLDVEETVLGALMVEPEAYLQVSHILKPETFYDLKNQKIYKAIRDLNADYQPVDMLTVTDQLQKNGDLEKAGGPVYITELAVRVYSASHIKAHARILVEKYVARQLIEVASNLQTKAFGQMDDVHELLQETDNKLLEIAKSGLDDGKHHLGHFLDQSFEDFYKAPQDGEEISGIRSGFTRLDNTTKGWQNGELIVVAARAAMGKTAFALSMAKNMAVDNNIHVGIFSLEMSGKALSNRLLSNVADISGDTIKSRRFSEDEIKRRDQRAGLLYNAPLHIIERRGMSIDELQTMARRMVREDGVKVIMIDYLQLITVPETKKNSIREQEVKTVCAKLKDLAMELQIPIIALAQLNRNVEARQDKRPMLSDIRESGAIEMTADIVCLLHRPEYYAKPGEIELNEGDRGKAELIIAKNRDGDVGDIHLRFVKHFCRFEDWETVNFDDAYTPTAIPA